MFFSNTNRTNNTNLASAWHLLSLGQYMLQDNGISKDNLCKDIGKYQNGIVWKTIRLFLLLYFCTMLGGCG